MPKSKTRKNAKYNPGKVYTTPKQPEQQLSCLQKFQRNVSDKFADAGATVVVYGMLSIVFVPIGVIGIMLLLKFIMYASKELDVDATTVLSIITGLIGG